MAMAGHRDAARQCRQAAEGARAANATLLAQWIDAVGDGLEGRGSHDTLCSATEAALKLPADLDGRFYAVAGLARFGGEQGADQAVQNLMNLVSDGFFPYETLMKHRWLDGLRRRPDFLSILHMAKEGTRKRRQPSCGREGKHC
jgi:hypothetical protein